MYNTTDKHTDVHIHYTHTPKAHIAIDNAGQITLHDHADCSNPVVVPVSPSAPLSLTAPGLACLVGRDYAGLSKKNIQQYCCVVIHTAVLCWCIHEYMCHKNRKLEYIAAKPGPSLPVHSVAASIYMFVAQTAMSEEK